MDITWTYKLTTHREPPLPHPFERIAEPGTGYRGYARGHVYKAGGAWYFEVLVNGRRIHADNTGHWRTIYDACRESTAAFDLVLATGHRLKDKT